MVADDPEDPKLHRQLAEALMEAGDRERGLEELDITLGMYEASEEWSRAEELVDEAERLIMQISEGGQKAGGPRAMAALLSGALERIEELYNSGGDITGLTTGLVTSGSFSLGGSGGTAGSGSLDFARSTSTLKIPFDFRLSIMAWVFTMPLERILSEPVCSST